MKMKWLWAILLLDFTALNIYAFARTGLAGLWSTLAELSPWGMVLTADLLIALAIGIGWMWRDARTRGISALPYALITAGTGSIGLLLYLLRRSRRAVDSPTSST
jgi:hypothetical protein